MPELNAAGARFCRMGESGLLVCFPNRMTGPINRRVHALSTLVREHIGRGIVDLVPAYATLLISFDPDITSHSDLEVALLPLLDQCAAPSAEAQSMGRQHTIPVQYGGDAGPDLADVAKMHGLSEREVVRLHSAKSYTVSFLGFLPGFGYMGKLSPKIASPRLASPRVKVPAGSVGIAGAQTAIYPLSSPGGWRILGRTSVPLWDPNGNPPALFAPGDCVKFVSSAYEPGPPEIVSPPTPPPLPALQVETAPGLTTVQDLGRFGLSHLGVAPGGAFDALSAARANALVGNEPGEAVLEMTWNGPTLRALRNLTIALDGAELECRVDGAVIPNRLSWFVRRGSMLRFSRTHAGRGGVRGYLAVSGGLDVPEVLGSRSTSLQARFGGFRGRALQVGDVLGVRSDTSDPGLIAGKYWLGPTPEMPEDSVTLRYLPYHGRGDTLPAAQRAFADSVFVLTGQGDRMGYRFAQASGEKLPVRGGELLSFGVVRGAIQLPPDGTPLVLNVDHQTTGGYPLLGVVIRADWSLLAQLAPGIQVRFLPVDIMEAERARQISIRELQNGYKLLGR